MEDEFGLEAKIYDKIWGRSDYDSDVRFLDSMFREYHCRSVVDIGCRTGNHALRLSKMGYEVTGVNISPSMLEKAREKDRKAKVKFVEGDMKRPDKSVPRNKKFDAAICLGIASSHLLTNKDVRAFLRGLQDSQKGRSASFRRQKREENQRRALEQVARGTHDN